MNSFFVILLFIQKKYCFKWIARKFQIKIRHQSTQQPNNTDHLARSFYILAFSFFTSWWLFTLPFISSPASAFNSSKLMFLSPFPFCGTPLVAIPGPSLCSLTSHTVFLFLLFSKLYFVISDRIYIIASHRWRDGVVFVDFFTQRSNINLFSQLYTCFI